MTATAEDHQTRLAELTAIHESMMGTSEIIGARLDALAHGPQGEHQGRNSAEYGTLNTVQQALAYALMDVESYQGFHKHPF